MVHPFNIYVVWHPDNAGGEEYANLIYSTFNRKVTEPWTRGIGIPVYFRTQKQENKSQPPSAIDFTKAERNAIIILADAELVNSGWDEWFDDLFDTTSKAEGSNLYPVAIASNGFNISSKIPELNFIRLFQKTDDESKKQFLVNKLAHEFCRLLYNKPRLSEAGKKNESAPPVRLFLSHAKADGVDITSMIKIYVEKDTGLKTFFDVNDIPAGESFSDVLKTGVAESTVIAIQSDAYSSRKWCRAEILEAKLNNCPVIVVDALKEGEVRSFPYMANAPVIRWMNDVSVEEDSKASGGLQKIVTTALLTTLKSKYLRLFLEALLEDQGFNKNDFYVMGGVPELLDLVYQPLISGEKGKQVLYPEPPLGMEELSLLGKYNQKISFQTPLQLLTMMANANAKPNNQRIVGISISEIAGHEQPGISTLHLQDLTVEMARYLIACDFQIAYGGDIKYEGEFNFAELLKDINLTYKAEYRETNNKVLNYAASPIFKQLDANFRADLKPYFKFIEVPPPSEFPSNIDASKMGDDERNYFFARCFTQMREVMNKDLSARIILGGKLFGFKGIYPGLVEEAIVAIKSKKPVYLIGGFGGCAKVVSDAIKGMKPVELSETFQFDKTPAYKNFVAYYNEKALANNLEKIDYQAIVSFLNSCGIAGLNNGLTDQENEILFSSIDTLEIVGLVLKGLNNVQWL